MKNNFWNVVGMALLIFLAIILLNNFAGVIEKSDILNFYSNLLVVIITVTLGVITYEQTKHIQEESSKETENLRRLNKEANETNKKLVDIIERNTELEEQRYMPCISIENQNQTYKANNKDEINIEFKNIGTTIIKYIDMEEIPEEIITQGIGKVLGSSIKAILEAISRAFNSCLTEHVEKTDFLKYFDHNINTVGIEEKIYIKAKLKEFKDKNDEYVYIIALNMKIENIYGKKYNEKIVILFKKNEESIYTIEDKYIDIELEH